jgi:pilus assembly protein FimV
MLKRLTIPSLLIMLSSGAQALTLGQIHVHSFIDQPLKATIDLHGVKAGELTALKVKLASRTDFRKAGVDWNKQLEGLSFSIIHNNKGSAIRVTSRKSVVEPFLSFVVDARWANGKMVKDFTLLLDPPLYSGNKAAAVDVADAASVTASQPVQSDKIKPLQQPRQQPQKPSVSPATPQGQEESAVTSPGSGKAGSATRTMTGVSLWQIASKARPAGATMQQTMIAIHEENPDSFIRGNMNLLKRGQLLRIPSAEVIRGISGSAAVKRVATHEKAMRAGKSVTLSKRLSPEIIALAPASAESPAQQAASDAPPSSAGSAGRLRLDSAADDVDEDEGAVSGEPASGETDLSTEATGSEETRALRSRVALLEEQLKVAHKLIRMKGELAQLQQLYRQIDAQNSKADVDQIEISDEQLLLLADADADSVAAEKTVSGEADQEPLSADDAHMKDEVLADDDPEQQQTSTAADKSEEVESSQDDANQPSPAAPGNGDPVVSDETPAEEQTASLPAETERVAGAGESEAAGAPDARRDVSLIGGIEDNLLFGAGGVVFLGLLLSFLIGRRRGERDTLPGLVYNDESLVGEVGVAVQESEGVPVRDSSAVDETPAQQPKRESPLLFEPPGTLSAEEPKAVDPLEFATLLIGNGAYRQAQEVLMQALETDPARTDLHMQLMELFHTEKNRRAFEAEMNQLENSRVDIDPGDWRRIENMHADLLPSGIDYSPVVNQEPFEVEVIEADGSNYGATESNSDADEAEAEAEAEGVGKSQSDADLEEALRAFEMVLEGKKSEAGFALDETATVVEKPVVSAIPSSEIVEDLELEDDLVVGDNAETVQGADVITLDDTFGIDSHINDDFDDLFTSGADQGKEEIDTLSLSEEERQPIAESEEFSVTSFNTDPSTLKQAEAEAKIDLAAAFADMGDMEGAREILGEVISEGTAKQQLAAREMLKKYL